MRCRLIQVRLYRIPWNNSKEKVFVGARENKLPKLQISQNEILRMKIFTCVFSIQGKFENLFSRALIRNCPVLLQITDYIYSP